MRNPKGQLLSRYAGDPVKLFVHIILAYSSAKMYWLFEASSLPAFDDSIVPILEFSQDPCTDAEYSTRRSRPFHHVSLSGPTRSSDLLNT